MAMQRITLGMAAAIALVGLVATALGALVATQTFSNTGTVLIRTVGVGVYSESACTTSLTSINWGTLSPGDQATRTIYVKNTGNVPVVLSMSVGNWNPPSANVITVTWDKGGTVLNAGQSVAAVITLQVPQSISGVETFSFEITITGTEQT